MGIYAWIRDGYGGRWASRATWCYWVNTAVWMPAIFILFAGVFKQMFFPELSLGWQIAIGVILTWLAVAVNVVALDVGKWIPNLGAILKVIIFLAIIAGAFIYVQDHGMANPLTFETLKPDWGNSLQYIPAIIYGMLGFELVSAGSDEMQDPARDVPRSIFISGVIILVLIPAGYHGGAGGYSRGGHQSGGGFDRYPAPVLRWLRGRQVVCAGPGYRCVSSPFSPTV